MTDKQIDDHIDVLETERENCILKQQHNVPAGRKQYWQDRIDAMDAAISALEDQQAPKADKQIDEALEAVDTIQEETTEYALGVTRSRYQHEINTIRQALERQRDRPPLEWKQHERDGEQHTEWTAPCGCAYHPRPFPHVHPCSDAHKRPDLHDGKRQRDGWLLVPVEPTRAMRKAGKGPWATSDPEEAARTTYMKMLAAAPNPNDQ